MKKVTLSIGPFWSHIEGRVRGDVQKKISDACSYQIDGIEHIKENDSSLKGWDGKIRLFNRKGRRFPTGLLGRVLRVLRSHGYQAHQVEQNVREIPEEALRPPSTNLWEFQKSVLRQAIIQGRGVISVATGGGKTRIASHIFGTLGLRGVFLVHTKDLLYQAKGAFSEAFGEENVGQVGDGIVDFRAVTVCTVQTLCRYLGTSYTPLDDEPNWEDAETPTEQVETLLRSVGVIIQDECHRVAAKTVQDVMKAFESGHHRFGLSASPWRDDNADIIIEGTFGPIFATWKASDLARLGHLVKPTIWMVEVPAMPGLQRKGYDAIYRQYVVDNELRNRMGCEAAIEMLADGRSVLMLVKHIRHGHILQQMMGGLIGYWPTFISGRSPDHERSAAIEDMRSGDKTLLIATSIADEGLDIPILSGLVRMGSGKSSVKALQIVGRTLRLFQGKEDARIIDFVDNARYLIKHSAERRKIYETEDEWNVVEADQVPHGAESYRFS